MTQFSLYRSIWLLQSSQSQSWETFRPQSPVVLPPGVRLVLLRLTGTRELWRIFTKIAKRSSPSLSKGQNFSSRKRCPALSRRGREVLVEKMLIIFVQINHTMTMSNVMPSGYRFGATYIGTSNVISPQESYPVILGDMDPSGNLQAHIIHGPTDRTR